MAVYSLGLLVGVLSAESKVGCQKTSYKYKWLVGGFKYFLFSSILGEDSHFDSYFSKELKPPTRWGCCKRKNGLNEWVSLAALAL